MEVNGNGADEEGERGRKGRDRASALDRASAFGGELMYSALRAQYVGRGATQTNVKRTDRTTGRQDRTYTEAGEQTGGRKIEQQR
jgi:hypothetical protein